MAPQKCTTKFTSFWILIIPQRFKWPGLKQLRLWLLARISVNWRCSTTSQEQQQSFAERKAASQLYLALTTCRSSARKTGVSWKRLSNKSKTTEFCRICERTPSPRFSNTWSPYPICGAALFTEREIVKSIAYTSLLMGNLKWRRPLKAKKLLAPNQPSSNHWNNYPIKTWKSIKCLTREETSC